MSPSSHRLVYHPVSLSSPKRLSIKEVQRLTEDSVSDPDSIRSDPGGQKRLQKEEEVKKFHALKCWMFLF
jgi:hypothetical protein